MPAVFPFLGVVGYEAEHRFEQISRDFPDGTYRRYLRSAFNHKTLNLQFSDFSKDDKNSIVNFFNARQASAPLANPTTAPTAAEGAAGNVNVGTHSWKVTFVAGTAETLPGPKSNVLNVLTSAKQVNLSSIPLGGTGTTARKIYRTITGDTGNWKLVGTISDNTTTTFVDNVADAALGADAPTANNTGDLEFFLYNPETVDAVDLSGVSTTGRHTARFADDELRVTRSTKGAWNLSINFKLLN